MEENVRLILSTRNRSKAEQIIALLNNVRADIVTLDDAGIDGDVEEDGETLEDNAIKKALFAHEQTREWALAEDTGFFIDALGGLPGIHAKRWAGENKSTDEIRDFALARLESVPEHKRTAHFMTVAAVVSPIGEVKTFTGKIKCTVLLEPVCESQPDMPYSSIVRPLGYPKVWAQMTVEEENKISHRGIAFRKVEEYLADFFR